MRCAASRTRAIAAQIALDAPFEITPIERLDYWFPDGLLWLEALPMTKALGDPQSWNQDFRADEWLLHRQGFDRILLTFPPDQGVRPEIDRLLTRAFGEPIRSPCASVWLIPDFDATNEQARVWSMQHKARLADVPRPNLLPPLRTGLAHPAPPLGDAPAAP